MIYYNKSFIPTKKKHNTFSSELNRTKKNTIYFESGSKKKASKCHIFYLLHSIQTEHLKLRFQITQTNKQTLVRFLMDENKLHKWEAYRIQLYRE